MHCKSDRMLSISFNLRPNGNIQISSKVGFRYKFVVREIRELPGSNRQFESFSKLTTWLK